MSDLYGKHMKRGLAAVAAAAVALGVAACGEDSSGAASGLSKREYKCGGDR